jgi:hypothetical protein
MPIAQPGQRVQVNISGLQDPGVSIVGSRMVTGRIQSVDVPHQLISVDLDEVFGGQVTLSVPPDRVNVFE